MLLRITLETSPGLRPEGLLGFWGPFVTTVGNTNQMKVRDPQRRTPPPLPSSPVLPPVPPWLVQLSISPVLRKQQVLAQSEVGAAILKRVQSDLLQQPLRVLRGVDGLAVISSGLLTLSKGAAHLAMDKAFITLRERQVPAPHSTLFLFSYTHLLPHSSLPTAGLDRTRARRSRVWWTA